MVIVLALSAFVMESFQKAVWHYNPDREEVENSIKNSPDIKKVIGEIEKIKVFKSIKYYAGKESQGYNEYRFRVDGELGMATVTAIRMDHEEEFSLRITRH